MATYVWTGTTSTAFATTTNWLKDDGTNEVPVDGSTIIFDGRAQNNCAGSDQSLIEPAIVRITSQFTKLIGTFSGGLITFLQLGPVLTIIGEPDADGNFGSGSAGIALAYTSDVNATRVVSTPNVGTSGFPPVILKGTATANTLQVQSGWVGYGTYFNDTSTLLTVSVLGPNANVELGSGCTLTTVNQTAGRLHFRSAITTLNQEGGYAKSEGSGTIATADIGGEFVSNSTGTITTLNVHNGGHGRFDDSNATRTVTTGHLFGTGQWTYPVPYSALTVTNGIDCQRGARTDQIHNVLDANVVFAAL